MQVISDLITEIASNSSDLSAETEITNYSYNTSANYVLCISKLRMFCFLDTLGSHTPQIREA